ncbi:MAG: hypothetical protein ABI325_12940 [Ginsengibacter sp.]
MNTGSTQYAELCYSTMINDIDTLERSVRDYPASSLARFLLLYHNKKNGHPGFDELSRQTGVYLNNPYWIQYQLSQADSSNEREIVSTDINNISTITNQPIVTEVAEIVTEVAENDSPNTENEELTSGAKNEINMSSISNQALVNGEAETDSSAIEIKEGTSVANNEDNTSAITNQPIATEEVENAPPNLEIEEDSSGANNEENVSTITHQLILSGESENDSPNTQNKDSIFEATNEIDTLPIINQLGIIDEVENAFAKNIDSDQHKTVKENDAIIAIQPAKDTVDNDSSEEEQIAFEPLHTVDYFASQGIKITREELEKDHLGKQVKSFTAWLKSMKRLHPGQVPEQNEVIEKIIQTSSEISNQNANVLTEAMAEVLIKQDKKQKAIEMYQKLSLINPSKSAYFAAKIESLKLT